MEMPGGLRTGKTVFVEAHKQLVGVQVTVTVTLPDGREVSRGVGFQESLAVFMKPWGRLDAQMWADCVFVALEALRRAIKGSIPEQLAR